MILTNKEEVYQYIWELIAAYDKKEDGDIKMNYFTVLQFFIDSFDNFEEYSDIIATLYPIVMEDISTEVAAVSETLFDYTFLNTYERNIIAKEIVYGN
jgi:hypothetical protein